MIYEPIPIGRFCRGCGLWTPRARLKKHKKMTDGVDTICMDCHSSRQRNYHVQHREQDNESVKRRYQRNKQPYIDRAQKWLHEHPEWRRENGRIYSKKRPEQARIKNHQRKARRRERIATFTLEDWRYALNYWGHRCAYCGRPLGLWHTLAQDHFIPESKGGNYTPDNILPACHGLGCCNNLKGDKNPVEWLPEHLGSKRKAAEKLREIEVFFATVRK